MIHGVEHAGLMSRNPLELAQWYQKLLDFNIVFKTDAAVPTVFIAGANGYMIEIFPYKAGAEYPSAISRQVAHLAIAVDNFEEAIRKLNEAKVELIGSPTEIFLNGKVQFFKDADGNWLHLVYRPQKPW